MVAAVALTSLAAVLFWGWTGGVSQVCHWFAERALAARNPEEAARWLDRSQRLGPADAQGELLRAKVARRQQDYEGVRRHLLRAHKLNGPPELLAREECLVFAQSGQLREAEPHLANLLSSSQGDAAEVCEAFVTGYLQTYQPAKAHMLLDGWIKDYPNDPLPHLIRGGISSGALNWKEAEASFRKALALEPGNQEAAVGLADVLVAQNQYDEALQWYQKGERGAQQRLPARLGLARCLEAMGKPDESHRALVALENEYPHEPSVLYALAQSELESRNDVRSRELLERALQGDPHNPGIRSALSAVLRRAGETEAADALSREATEMAAARIRSERLLEKIAAQPRDVALRYELGTLQLKYGSEREGLMWLKSVLDFQPDHAAATEALKRYEANRKRSAAN